MRELIYNYLKSLPKKRVKTLELQNHIYHALGQKQFLEMGGYPTFADTLKQLEDEGIIRGIKAWKTNGKSPLLYNGYQFMGKTHQLDQKVKKELMTCFHPVINVAYYLTHPTDYQKDEYYLHAIDAFFKDSKGFRKLEPITVNERSFQIFRDEKWLNSPQGQSFLQRVAVTLDDLKCYQTHEPFFYYRRQSDRKLENVLIVENKDTFFSLKKLFQKDITTWDSVNFSLLIYGEGWKILKSFKFFYELDFSSSFDINFYYFGDLDPMGIAIWYKLRIVEEIDIKPFVFFYKFLLDKWGDSPPKMSKTHNNDVQALETFLRFFSDEQSQIIKHLWANNYYIPQEGLNYNYMEILASNLSKPGI